MVRVVISINGNLQELETILVWISHIKLFKMRTTERMNVSSKDYVAYKEAFCAHFFHNDASIPTKEFYEEFPPEMYFDMVSCQFSMHYMFSSEEKVRNLLSNISHRLLKGGYFIATHPDANVIIKKLRNDFFLDPATKCHVSENKFYSLIMEDMEFPKSKGAFNIPYGFFLTDNLVGFEVIDEKTNEKSIHYVPEYIVILKPLKKLAKEYGLELVDSKNLHDFFAENINEPDYHSLFTERMKFSFAEGQTTLMDKELWDVSYLYR